MEMDQIQFIKTLEALKENARLQNNQLTSMEINEAFEAMELDENALKLIYEYLEKNKIGVDKEAPIDENLSEEDMSYLNLYLEELKDLPKVTDGEKRAITMSALAKDADACNRLVEIYLPQVVEIAKLYTGQGALVEDLIGEGNVAVAMASTMLDCVESIDEVEGFIVKMIMDAMEELISEDLESKKVDESILSKVNLVHEKSEEMAKEYLRKVTPQEVAEELNISVDEVLEAIELSANHMDYIEGGSNDEQ